MEKKQIFFLLLVFIYTIMFTSCKRKSINNPLIEKNKFPPVSINEKEWPFTMNYSYAHRNQPIVHLILGQSDYYFVFDTGAPYSTLDSETDSSMDVFDTKKKKAIG